MEREEEEEKEKGGEEHLKSCLLIYSNGLHLPQKTERQKQQQHSNGENRKEQLCTSTPCGQSNWEGTFRCDIQTLTEGSVLEWH